MCLPGGFDRDDHSSGWRSGNIFVRKEVRDLPIPTASLRRARPKLSPHFACTISPSQPSGEGVAAHQRRQRGHRSRRHWTCRRPARSRPDRRYWRRRQGRAPAGRYRPASAAPAASSPARAVATICSADSARPVSAREGALEAGARDPGLQAAFEPAPAVRAGIFPGRRPGQRNMTEFAGNAAHAFDQPARR